MKKLFLLFVLMAMALFFSNTSVVATELTTPVSINFPVDIRIIVEDDEDEIAEVVALGGQGFDYIYQAGIQDWEEGYVTLTFLLHTQEELDYFNNSGLTFEIVEPEPVEPEEPKPFAAASVPIMAASMEINSAYWYTVREADGFITGLAGGNNTTGNIRPGRPMGEDIVNGNVWFDPTGVTFNETYGFPNRAGYRSVEEYYGEMFYLAKTYPHLVKLHKIGESWYYPVYVMEICNAPGVEDGRPEWLSLAAQHAREWPANELVINNAWWLVTQYDKYLKGGTVEPRIVEVMESIRTWSAPMYGPDGVWYDQTGVTAGTNRSNRRPGASYVSSATNEVLQNYKTGGTNGHGRFYDTSTTASTGNQPVDLNRNFAYRWGSNDGSTTQVSNTGGSTHRGFFPLSEPENRNIAALVARRMIMADYSGHTFGGLVIYPWDNKKSLAVTENMNFEDLGRILSRYNSYNDYHERVIYSQSGEGQGFMFGSWRTLGFTYEMGYNYNATSSINFVPPFNGAASTFRVAVGNFADKNPNLSVNGLNGSVNGASGPAITRSDIPKGTVVAPLRYTTAANTGMIQREVTAPIVVMMPECVTNTHNSTNCRKDAYGNSTGDYCYYHSAFQTTYTTTELLATPARLTQMLNADPDFVRGKILLCYSGSSAANNTTLVQNARDAGAVAVIFAQIANSNNADSNHAFTGGPTMSAMTGTAIPVALIPRPFAKTIHDNVKEMAAEGSAATLTLLPGFYNWNTQMMEWERNCYSFLQLALFAKEYAGAITGKVTGSDDSVVKGARLDLSLEVKAPLLRPEFSTDTFFWNQSVLTTTSANNIHSQRDRIGSKLTEYVHPVTGDTINVTNWQHTSYIDQFGADGSFKWNVNPSKQFDTYMYEGYRQPPTSSGTGVNMRRGTAGGFEVNSATDPRIGTILFPNDGYKVTASAPGYYNYARQVVVSDYKVTANADFKLTEAITARINAITLLSVNGVTRIPFSTFVLDEADNTSVKGVVEDATVHAVINGEPAQVVSLSNGDYEVVFRAADYGLTVGDEAELIIDFTGGQAHSAFVDTIVIDEAVAPGITGPASMTLTEGYAATSTVAYTLTGNPVPTAEKSSGNALISWNGTAFNIATGLTAGTYPVVLTATNGFYTDATFNFTLTVHDAPGADGRYTWEYNGILYSSIDRLQRDIPDNTPALVKQLKDADSLLTIERKIITFDLEGYNMSVGIHAKSGSVVTLNGGISGVVAAYGDGTAVNVKGDARNGVSAHEGGTVNVEGDVNNGVSANDYGTVNIGIDVYGNIEAGNFATVMVGVDVFGYVKAYTGGTVIIGGDVFGSAWEDNGKIIGNVMVSTGGTVRIDDSLNVEDDNYFVMVDEQWLFKQEGITSNSKPGYFEYSMYDHSISSKAAAWVKNVDIAPALIVNGVKIPVTVVNGVAVLEPTQERMAAILSAAGNDIVFDLKGYDAVNLAVGATWFKDVDKTITIVTAKGTISEKTKMLWNNSGMTRVISVKNGKSSITNINNK